MSHKVRQALQNSIHMVEQNSPVIEKILRTAGISVSDPDLVFSVARYFDALNKLARE